MFILSHFIPSKHNIRISLESSKKRAVLGFCFSFRRSLSDLTLHNHSEISFNTPTHYTRFHIWANPIVTGWVAPPKNTSYVAMEEVEEDNNNKRVRVFVGGLGEGVTAEDLRKLFGSLGSVDGIETIRTKGRSFAYVDFIPSPTDQKSLSKLFSKYNGCLWKGGKLKLEKAKEHYLMRLKKEWEEDAAAELVSSQQGTTNLDHDKGVSLEEMPKRREISETKPKQLQIFFPRLKKVKSIPFSGTGKHKYSFQNIKVPPLPVHFCDCEEHCSPSGTERGKLSFDGVAESGGINDEEINVMNAVMNKLFEKEKVSNIKHLEKQQDSFEPADALHSNECEVDSETDEDDLIINMQTNKNKATLTGSQELERILQMQESLLNETRIAKEEPNKTMLEVKKRNNNNPNKKRRSLPQLEKESNGCVSTTLGGKSNMQTLPDELGSGVQPAELEDGFGELSKVSWSQKSSWKKLLGDGVNTAFNASLILPKFDSDKDQQRSDSPCIPSPANKKTENMERDGHLMNRPTDTQVIGELAEAQPTDTKDEAQPTETQVIEELAEAPPTDTQAEVQPTDKNVAPNKTGRGASWLQKQSWTQLVGENSKSFSISQILPGITFPEPMAKEPIVDPANSNDSKHNGAKDAINEVLSDGFNSGEIVPEKSQHVGATDIASAPIVEEKIETRPRERTTEETIPKARSTEDVEIGETCSFMRSAASLREWAKAKAALSGSLKRKRGEK